MLASHFPESVTHSEKIRSLSAECDELRFVIDRETRELLNELRTIRGVEPLAEVFKEALKVRLSKLRPIESQCAKLANEKRAFNTAARKTLSPKTTPAKAPQSMPPQSTTSKTSVPESFTPAQFTWAPTLATANDHKLISSIADHPKTSPTEVAVDQSTAPLKRYIPAQIRAHVRERSQNRCEYQDKQTQRRCLSQTHLQFEHRLPFAKGGAHTVQNILHFCAEHNRLRAIEEFGARKMSQYFKR